MSASRTHSHRRPATDIYVGLNFARSRAALHDITRLDELKGITEREDMVLIGAGHPTPRSCNPRRAGDGFPMLVGIIARRRVQDPEPRQPLGRHIANGSPAVTPSRFLRRRIRPL